VALAAVVSAGARAQSFEVVHNFTGADDGANPVDGFAMGSTGVLYGVASAGGASGNGVVFRVMATGKVTVLHNFTGGADGAAPFGRVIVGPNDTLFGTTMAGGTSGAGTVFRLKGKREKVLYSFAGGTHGAAPQAELTMDDAGNLYGTTSAGGASGNGTVFELVAPQKENGAWKEVILYSFGTGTDGATPLAGVTLDAAGNLYGTTSVGGAKGFGTVFKLTHGATWTETIVHHFQDTDDGAYPYAGLVADAHGNLYGGATQGGTDGGGTIFRLTPGGTSFSVVASVPGAAISGAWRNLLIADNGTIYGTTHCDGDYGAGTLFMLTPSGNGWTYKLLYTFTGGSDGEYAISNLVMKGGKLYGTALQGGAHDAGVIYRLTP
jgi:uncharacterized repeat protein (TIGR03803 family)